MTVATISSKGQITLPAEARRAVGLKPGNRVAIETEAGRIVIRRAPDFLALKGVLGRALPRDKERAGMLRAAAQKSGAKR
jgi:AbrB family looped-hinge helix DNA binding protein